jgi:hypothetical protein
MSKVVCFNSVVFGCDPEFFFSKNNKICGSEKIISENGKSISGGRIIRDGVQAELNPLSNTCRESLANNIRNCFINLNQTLLEKNATVSFDEVVKISREEMDSLSKESKTFGCAPSLNLYESGESKIKVNPEIYKYRSAGGHIHLGHCGSVVYNGYTAGGNLFSKIVTLYNKKYEGISIHELNNKEKTKPIIDILYEKSYNRLPKDDYNITTSNDVKVFQEYEELIYLLDILVGNTGVLLDRNPLAVERRKVYGRAGEFRLTNYGVEYRVLSNFWLKNYTVYSLMFALARFAVCILTSDKNYKNTNFFDEITCKVKGKNIERAINENDFDLAMKNYLAIEKTLCEIVKGSSYTFPINNMYKTAFHNLVKNGINHYFKQDILKHWMYLGDDSSNRRYGWESWADMHLVK